MIKLCFLNAYMISFYLSETFVFPSFCIWNDIYKIYKKSGYENGHTYQMLCLVLQCCEALQKTDSVLKLLFGNSFERSRLIS